MSNDPNNKRRLPRIILRGRGTPQSTTPAKQSEQTPAQDEGKLRVGGFTISPWMLTILGAIISRMSFGGGNNSNNSGTRSRRSRSNSNNQGGFRIGNPFGCGCRTLAILIILVIIGALVIFRVVPIGPFGR
jgi:hypothetical protein